MEILNAIAFAFSLLSALGTAATVATKVRDAIPPAQVEPAAPELAPDPFAPHNEDW